MIHSGSRFLGGLLKNHYAGKSPLLKSMEAAEFLRDQRITVEFARLSRIEMAQRVISCISDVCAQSCHLIEQIDRPHNIVTIEQHGGSELAVHRKGACTALANARGIIPGSMGTGSYIVEGKGSPWSYNSSSHGAGRCMSRGEAFRRLSSRELFSDMAGIVWGSSERLKDEAPRAYKDIDVVMRAQRDLVRVVCKLQPLLVVKGEN